MKNYISIPLVFLIFYALSGCCTPEIMGSVKNTLRAQETNNWCWAATTQMLGQHFDINVNQCDLANHVLSKSTCCDFENSREACPKNSDCNNPGWLELDHIGLKFSESGTGLSWSNIKKQLYCQSKPMGYAYGTPGIVGHVVVIKGYITVGNTDYIILNDPWLPCDGEERLITYEQYENPAGTATHWNTWYDLAKKDN